MDQNGDDFELDSDQVTTLREFPVADPYDDGEEAKTTLHRLNAVTISPGAP